MSISTDIRQPHMQLPHFRVVGVRVNLTELSADDLRRELVALALEWECRYGVSPSITGVVSEYDTARLIGHSPESFGH